MDRCALFVDAGYVLADGAMAVHGTRRGESVSWDYEGLLQLMSSLARERSGLPLLRCYWYDTSADGRRTAEHDALADLPGVKLRLAKVRPGRREGVDTEIHRDLTTLARNNAVSDAVVVSAEEDLAEVISDVQDLGMRVTLVHIAVDGNWTLSRTLRQESDDLIEIGEEHLRPYVELIAGAEPAMPDDEPDGAVAVRSNGHLAGVGSYQGSGNHTPPAIYTAPVVAEYQRPALQIPRNTAREDRAAAREERIAAAREERTAAARDERPMADRARENGTREERIREDRPAPAEPAAEAVQAPPAPAQLRRLSSRGPARDARTERDDRNGREDRNGRDERNGREPIQLQSAPPLQVAPQPGPQHSAPQLGTGQHSASQHSASQHNAGQHGANQLGASQLGANHVAANQANQAPQNQAPSVQQMPQPSSTPSARSAPYSGPQPVMPSSGYSTAQPAVSLADAVQAAHEEGQDFGESVARDAPALWLEAVLARKPRMPSDLEARLLQGSALPIDFLLHDEVRHALRRGFWDALERTRR